jgi:hypothetical protein
MFRPARELFVRKKKAATPVCTGVTASVDTVSLIAHTAKNVRGIGVVQLTSQLRTEPNLSGCNFRGHGQSVLDLEFLDFAVAQFRTVAHQA